MEEVVVSPFSPFLFLLLYLPTIQEAPVSPPIKIGWFHGSKFSVNDIFTANYNWYRYYYFHRRQIRKVEKEEVEKMMNCKGPDRGCFTYYCPKCEEYYDVPIGLQ